MSPVYTLWSDVDQAARLLDEANDAEHRGDNALAASLVERASEILEGASSRAESTVDYLNKAVRP